MPGVSTAAPTTGGFRRGPDNPLDSDLLVVDETSMVDVLLMNALLKAVPPHAALLIVGDVDLQDLALGASATTKPRVAFGDWPLFWPESAHAG
jgi:ATP-dependent exoDNAse (exonuclease V) alpha subunit